MTARQVELLKAGQQAMVWSFNVIGLAGIFLIAYSFIVWRTGGSWKVLDTIASAASKYLTLIGTILTAGSIYLPPNQRVPEEFSRYISGPLVIISAAIVGLLALSGKPIPEHTINGFALLSISGALFRLASR